MLICKNQSKTRWMDRHGRISMVGWLVGRLDGWVSSDKINIKEYWFVYNINCSFDRRQSRKETNQRTTCSRSSNSTCFHSPGDNRPEQKVKSRKSAVRVRVPV